MHQALHIYYSSSSDFDLDLYFIIPNLQKTYL